MHAVQGCGGASHTRGSTSEPAQRSPRLMSRFSPRFATFGNRRQARLSRLPRRAGAARSFSLRTSAPWSTSLLSCPACGAKYNTASTTRMDRLSIRLSTDSLAMCCHRRRVCQCSSPKRLTWLATDLEFLGGRDVRVLHHSRLCFVVLALTLFVVGEKEVRQHASKIKCQITCLAEIRSAQPRSESQLASS